MTRVQEMYETGKFDICIPLNNGVWVNSLDLVCRNEMCMSCSYGSTTPDFVCICEFGSIEEKEIEKYLIENKPREILRLIQKMQLPQANVKYWHGKIKEKFSVEDYPEIWV